MNTRMLSMLCDPEDGSELQLEDPIYSDKGVIKEGRLVSISTGRVYPIVRGIPRFVGCDSPIKDAVDSFGDEWNFFNFTDFKLNWLQHTVRNTFGSTDFFKGKTIVDAGAGSGAQSRWMAESGARHVIALELSHSVDEVLIRNTGELENVDIIQCSIDNVPLKSSCIPDLVLCHNVIQHTASVERTARELWRLVAPGGEFAFNCYGRDDQNFIRRLRLKWYGLLRNFLSKRSFSFRMNYSRIVSLVRFIPLLGVLLEKSYVVVRGDVPSGPRRLYRLYKAGVLNTFDCYGSHEFQHLKSPAEIRSLVKELQPDDSRVRNLDLYFRRPPPIGCALRVEK